MAIFLVYLVALHFRSYFVWCLLYTLLNNENRSSLLVLLFLLCWEASFVWMMAVRPVSLPIAAAIHIVIIRVITYRATFFFSRIFMYIICVSICKIMSLYGRFVLLKNYNEQKKSEKKHLHSNWIENVKRQRTQSNECVYDFVRAYTYLCICMLFRPIKSVDTFSMNWISTV